MDDFPPAPQLLKYLNGYCDHFGLRPCIHLSTSVNRVKRADGRWTLGVRKAGDEGPRTECFDKVAFACGPFTTPRKPDLAGVHQFRGKAVHSIDFHKPSQFNGQTVVVVGLHASAQDVVTPAIEARFEGVPLSQIQSPPSTCQRFARPTGIR